MSKSVAAARMSGVQHIQSGPQTHLGLLTHTLGGDGSGAHGGGGAALSRLTERRALQQHKPRTWP